MELDTQKIEELLFDSQEFKELKKLVENKKRTIFNIIAKESDELTFSRILKYFLDPNEDHNLGDYFLRRFISIFIKLNNISGISRLYVDSLNLKNCNVHREFPIKEFGRIDIFIELDKEFALIIENKLYSEEGAEQTKRYENWAKSYISKKYKHLLFCFFSPDGKLAESEYFKSLSIGDVIPIFKNTTLINQLNQDNKFLLEHFSNWMEELKMIDTELIKTCRSIYKKYKNEINIIIENAPTITAFLKDIAISTNKKINEYYAHSATDWFTLSPKKWIEKENLKATAKYSKVRIEYNYIFDSSNLFLTLVIPNSDEFINILKNKSNELFNLEFENIQSWKNWGSIYSPIRKWESFKIEDYIDSWDDSVAEFSTLVLDNMLKVKSLLEEDLMKL